jgi:hypothetical protein
MAPRTFLALALLLVATPAWAAPSPGPTCPTSVGGRVVLSSDAVDPDVFLWDSRDQLVDYVAGHWGSTRTIFSHTVIAKPGTRATVVACYPSIAHPRNSPTPMDAIGVRVVNGALRGRYGWVLSSDLHPETSAQQSK